MGLKMKLLLVATLLVPAISWAGTPSLPVTNAPALSEIGLIALGAGLIGIGGLGIFRRKR